MKKLALLPWAFCLSFLLLLPLASGETSQLSINSLLRENDPFLISDITPYLNKEPYPYSCEKFDLIVQEICADPIYLLTCTEFFLKVPNAILRPWDGFEDSLKKENYSASYQQPIYYVALESQVNGYTCWDGYLIQHEGNRLQRASIGLYTQEQKKRMANWREQYDSETLTVDFIVRMAICQKGLFSYETETFSVPCPVLPVTDQCSLSQPISFPKCNLVLEEYTVFFTPIQMFESVSWDVIHPPKEKNYYWGLFLESGERVGISTGLPNQVYFTIYSAETGERHYQKPLIRQENEYHVSTEK